MQKLGTDNVLKLISQKKLNKKDKIKLGNNILQTEK